MAETFATSYGQEPWSGIDRKTIPYYIPELLDTFRGHNVYAGFTTFAVDMRQNAAETMIFTEIYDLEFNKAAIDNRELWLPTQYLDSRKLQITCEHHGDKIALHKYDPMVTYWRRNGGDLRMISRNALGMSMVSYIDELTRDAYLSGPFWLISGHTSGTKSASGYPNFGVIVEANKFDVGVAAKVWLIMDEKNVPMANDPKGLGGRTCFCVTTPGVWYDLNTDETSRFTEILEILENRELLMNYEVGQYLNVRFIKTGKNVLWNCGEWDNAAGYQTTLAVACAIGSGASATVDMVYTVGQAVLRAHSDATAGLRYITVADATGMAVGDVITIHKTRTAKYGVTNGVDFKEGTLSNRRIVSIDGVNIGLDKPILKCEYDIGAYVTKGINVHANIFIGGPRGVVWAVTQSPAMMQPPTIDDLMAQARFSWDMYAKPQPFRPEYVYVVYSAGSSSEGMLP